MINLSQFHIIHDAGPVSSTVVGHLKTVLIVGLGWILRGKHAGDGSLIGVILALIGITWSVIIEAMIVLQLTCTNV